MQAIIDNLLFPTAMLLIGGLLVGLWGLLRRGMVATVKDMSADSSGRTEAQTTKEPHSGPCAVLVAHKQQSASNWTEIFLRIANIDNAQRDIQQTLIRRLERDAKVDEQINFLASRVGFRDTKKADDVIPSRDTKTSKTLLMLVDDRPETLAPLIGMIEALGFSVTVLNNAEDGWDAIATAPFRCAVIDAEMDTKTDGIELAARIKKQYPDIDVVLYTGHDLDSTPANVAYYKKTDWKDLIHHLASVKQKEAFRDGSYKT